MSDRVRIQSAVAAVPAGNVCKVLLLHAGRSLPDEQQIAVSAVVYVPDAFAVEREEATTFWLPVSPPDHCSQEPSVVEQMFPVFRLRRRCTVVVVLPSNPLTSREPMTSISVGSAACLLVLACF